MDSAPFLHNFSCRTYDNCLILRVDKILISFGRFPTDSNDVQSCSVVASVYTEAENEFKKSKLFKASVENA